MALGKLNQIAILTKAGLNPNEMDSFEAAGKANPKTAALLESISKDTNLKSDTEEKLLSAMAKKWKADPALFSKMEKDLAANPKLASQISSSVVTKPALIIDAVEKYKGGNLPTLLGMTPEVGRPAQENKQEQRPTTPVAMVSEPSAEPKGKKNKSAAPVVAADVTSPEAKPTISVNPIAPKGEEEPSPEVLEAFAAGSDKEISAAMSPAIVKSILKGMSDQASSKFGVSAATAEGFNKRVATDPALLDKVTTNFQNNPEFVRQLAKAAKDKEPLSKEMRDMARPIMTSVMENPENLADDKYVKDLSQKMKMGSSMGGFGKMLSGVFGEGFGEKISGWFNAIFDKIKSFFSGFTGDKSVLSMNSGGKGSLFPSVMVNLDNITANRDAAAAQARYNPNQMTAFSPKGEDGKFVHNGAPVTDKDGKQVVKNGKPVFEEVPNGQITLKTADGKDVKVIPSVGVLTAKQLPGQYAPNGEYVRGNIQVPVVTGVNEFGASDKISTVVLTPAQFNEYKKLADAEAKKRGGSIQELAFESYTEADAAERASKGKTVQMATVNPKTGEASPVTAVNVATPQESNPSVGYTVANGTVMRKPDPAANDPEYALRGNG